MSSASHVESPEVELGEICRFINGRAFKTTEWATSGLPIIRIQNLNNPGADFNFFNGELDDRHRVLNGDLLFAWSGTPGTSFGAHIWTGPTAALNQHIYKVETINDGSNPIYIKFAINEKIEELIQQAKGGVGLQHITKGAVEKTKIRLPPIEVQNLIVEKISLYQEKFDAARKGIANSINLVDSYKRAFMATEFGRETPPLLDSTRQYCALVDMIDEGPTNGWSPKTGPDAKGALTLKLTATTSGQMRLDDQATKRIYETPDSDSKYWLRPGDLLIQRANAIEHLGASAIYDGPPGTYIYPDLMMRVRLEDADKRRYLWLYLNSPQARAYLRSNATGTSGSMPKISGKILRSLPVPLPRNSDYARAAERIQARLEEADDLLMTIKASAEKLRRAEQVVISSIVAGKAKSRPHEDPRPSDERISKARIKPKTHAPTGRPESEEVLGRSTDSGKDLTIPRAGNGNGSSQLSKALTSLGGSADPRQLWKVSNLSIDNYFKQLRLSIDSGEILISPDGSLLENSREN